MSKKMAILLMAYGVALGTLGFTFPTTTPGSAQVTLITSAAVGGLCVLWGIVALAGHKRRAWAVLTIVAATFVLLSQMVQAWLAWLTGPAIAGPLLLTLMMLMTVGMLMYLLHGERSPEFYTMGTAQPDRPSSVENSVRSERSKHQPNSR